MGSIFVKPCGVQQRRQSSDPALHQSQMPFWYFHGQAHLGNLGCTWIQGGIRKNTLLYNRSLQGFTRHDTLTVWESCRVPLRGSLFLLDLWSTSYGHLCVIVHDFICHKNYPYDNHVGTHDKDFFQPI